jgi:hypothetical protein
VRDAISNLASSSKDPFGLLILDPAAEFWDYTVSAAKVLLVYDLPSSEYQGKHVEKVLSIPHFS